MAHVLLPLMDIGEGGVDGFRNLLLVMWVQGFFEEAAYIVLRTSYRNFSVYNKGLFAQILVTRYGFFMGGIFVLRFHWVGA